MENVNKKCEFCGNEVVDNNNKNIIPQLFVDKLKNSTSDLQNGSQKTVNILCDACNEVLVELENKFSPIYDAIANGKVSQLNCDDNLRFFSLSLFWKELSYALARLETSKNSKITDDEKKKLEETCEKWKNILLTKDRQKLLMEKQKIVFYDQITTLSTMPEVVGHRVAKSTIYIAKRKDNSTIGYIFILVPHLMFICPLFGEKDILISNNINSNPSVKSRNTKLPQVVLNMINVLINSVEEGIVNDEIDENDNSTTEQTKSKKKIKEKKKKEKNNKVVSEESVVEEPETTEEVVEETIVVEEKLIEETPVVEERLIEETPVVEEKLIEETPIVEEELIEETIVEEPVVVEEVVEEPETTEEIVEETPVEEPKTTVVTTTSTTTSTSTDTTRRKIFRKAKF